MTMIDSIKNASSDFQLLLEGLRVIKIKSRLAKSFKPVCLCILYIIGPCIR